MPRFLLECELAGAGFAGTQAQKAQRTVQQVLAQAVASLDGCDRHVRPASRLDAGVDAERLPCDVELGRDWEPGELCQALSARLPEDLVVRRAARVPDAFNAIGDATGKTYRYRIAVRPIRPVLHRRAWWLRRMDHPDILQPLADLLPGSRDLSGFATLRHDGTDGNDPVRRIDQARWELARDGDDLLLTFTIAGAGFLYRQVRGLVGAMACVACGTRTRDDFAAVVAQGKAAPRVGNIAPPEGLCLIAVRYDPEPAWVPAGGVAPAAPA